MFAQISVKQGIKQFKEQDVDDNVKGNKQPYDITMFGTFFPDDLTTKQKRYLIRTITLSKKKRWGKFK